MNKQPLTGNCQPVIDFIKSLGLDPYTTESIFISIEAGSLVRIRVKETATDETLNELAALVRNYKLVPINYGE